MISTFALPESSTSPNHIPLTLVPRNPATPAAAVPGYPPCQRLLEDAELDEERHQVPTGNVVHHKVQAILVLRKT